MATRSKSLKYNPSWENEKWALGWLKKNEGPDKDVKQAYCKVCLRSYRAHHTDLMKHSSNDSHSNAAKILNIKTQQKITKFQNNDETASKKIDLKLAMFTACHTSIKAIDHLSSALRSLELKGLAPHLGRTKCTSVIKYVIAPSLLDELIKDIGTSQFSLIVDESTDFTKCKYLNLCVRYFSESEICVITDFLVLLEVEEADHQSLYKLVKDHFEKVGLKINKIHGLGTDGGSNLCGKRNSLYTLLKKESPSIQLVRCICHALDNAASRSADKLPSAIEFILHEVHNWFSESSLRNVKYKRLWNALNYIDESLGIEKKDFHKFEDLSRTRWLARHRAVKTIREQYFELEKYFEDVVNSGEKSYKGRVLCSMFKDHSNYLYLLIIEPVLFEINCVNLSFQKEYVNVNTAYDDVKDLILLLADKIVQQKYSQNLEAITSIFEKENNSFFFKPLSDCKFGIEYIYALKDRITISNERKYEIESHAFDYFKKLLQELVTRLPENIQHFEKIKLISTQVCLSPLLRADFIDLPFIDTFIDKNDLKIVENEYSKLHTVDWKSLLTEEELNNSFKFWPKVYMHKNAGGFYAFRKLARYVLDILSLPSSNAVVERVFSVMKATRTKSRNRMQLELLNAILRIKIRCFSRKICCNTFEPTQDMIKNMTSRILYDFQYENPSDEARSILNVEIDAEDVNILDVCFPSIHIPEI